MRSALLAICLATVACASAPAAHNLDEAGRYSSGSVLQTYGGMLVVSGALGAVGSMGMLAAGAKAYDQGGAGLVGAAVGTTLLSALFIGAGVHLISAGNKAMAEPAAWVVPVPVAQEQPRPRLHRAKMQPVTWTKTATTDRGGLQWEN